MANRRFNKLTTRRIFANQHGFNANSFRRGFAITRLFMSEKSLQSANEEFARLKESTNASSSHSATTAQTSETEETA